MKRRLAVALVGVVGALVVPMTSAAAPPEVLDVVHFDVGHGAATLYRGPCGEVGLVDANPAAAEKVLDQLGVWDGRSALRWVAVTNYNDEHLGGILDVLTADGVNARVYDRGGDADANDSQTYRAYHTYVTGQGVRSPVDIGDAFSLCDGEVAVEVVSAGTDGTAAGGVPVALEGDRGLCLTIRFSVFDTVNCGDINGTDVGDRADVESAAAPAVGDVDWVLVNQHGSAYSSNATWVDTLQAEGGVVSAGPDTPGYPHDHIDSRWGDIKWLLRTANPDRRRTLDGDITIAYARGATHYIISSLTRSDIAINRPVDETPETVDRPTGVHRLAGSTRVDTAIKVSRAVFDAADVAVLATSADFPDALSGAVLAAAVDGPMLLTEPDHAPAELMAELGRLGVDRVIVLGGRSAVHESVVAQLDAHGLDVDRIGGADRYETAVNVARATGRGHIVMVSSGTTYADAVAASAYAAHRGWPILLVEPDHVPASVHQFIDEQQTSRAVPVGGRSAMAKAPLDELRHQGIEVTERLSGPDRYRTSALIARRHQHTLGKAAAEVWIATGESFPDALAAGAAAAKAGAVLLLAPRDSLSPRDSKTVISGYARGEVLVFRACHDGVGALTSGTLIGGQAALADSVQSELGDILGCRGSWTPAPDEY